MSFHQSWLLQQATISLNVYAILMKIHFLSESYANQHPLNDRSPLLLLLPPKMTWNYNIGPAFAMLLEERLVTQCGAQVVSLQRSSSDIGNGHDFFFSFSKEFDLGIPKTKNGTP